MSRGVKVLLLYGGKSGEHEVSLNSAASVLQHLNTGTYQINAVAMDKQGHFHLHDYEDLIPFKDKLPVKTDKSRCLPGLMLNGRLAIDADVVFPVVHGPLYEDGCLQGLLRLTDTAFVGCDVLASAIGMDKDIARRLACMDGLKCAPYRVLTWKSSPSERQRFCADVAEALGWPVFVKPCSLGSSVGIHKVYNPQQLNEGIDDALRYDESVIVEQFIKGREIELAVLESPSRPQPRVSTAGEISVHHADGFYSYSAKYLESNQTDLLIPASVDDALLTRLQQAAADIFMRLKCRGMARVDFFVDETENIYFNEINTLPGFTAISMYPKLWQASGKHYSELLDELIESGLAHQHYRQRIVTDYL